MVALWLGPQPIIFIRKHYIFIIPSCIIIRNQSLSLDFIARVGPGARLVPSYCAIHERYTATSPSVEDARIGTDSVSEGT